ncbi:SNF2 family N-terminal domain-containing protein [Rhexocercosporidium sp. MPI-PUGE-AT-0058]|nr:SNF2 family N-terminal domain-containing protein [Rhexocercosporidium sp. MPI-PUGE-AT-0058]
MSQAASSQVTQEMNELQEEILFQKVLLQSIDDHVQNREAAEQEVRDEIHSLERKLNQLKRAAKATSSSSKPSSQNFQSTPQQPTSSSAGEDPTSVAMNGYRASEQWYPQSSAASMASTPGTTDCLGDLVSPSKMNLPTRKRSHSTHLDGQLAPVDNKSRRTSLSPFGTGPPTPATSSSSDDKFDVFDRDFFQLQHDEVSRLELERLDEEFARTIQESFDAPRMSAPSSSMQPPGRNAFDRMSGAHQTYVNPYSSSPANQYHNGIKAGKKLPWGPPRASLSDYSNSIKAEPRSMHSGMKQEAPSNFAPHSSYASSPAQNPFKREQTSRPMPGSFQDDSSTASDSDIEIIPASAFRDNGRHSYTKVETPSFAPGSSRSSGSNDALQQALFGNQVKHEWMNGIQPGMNRDFVYPQPMQQGQNIDLTDDFLLDDLPIFTGFGAAHMANPDPNLADMIARANGHNNYNEISEYLRLDQQRIDQLGYVMNDPRKNAEEIQALLENIQPDVEITPENREGTPEALVYPLYEHQKIALAWMKAMEAGTNKGGILADDMGLGKTISALALIHSRPSNDPARKTTLVVGPVALVRQWDRELRNKTLPMYRLSTHMVHGNGRRLSWDELRTYDVVFTTYGTLGAEYKRLQKLYDKMKLDGITHQDHNEMKKTFPLLGPKSTWYRILLDEAQCIKNKSTGAARACCTLQALHRFCLTGTPMMNNVGELYSLIHFLRIKPYNEWTRFQGVFGCLTKPDPNRSTQRNADGAMKKLQVLLKAILLRRTKKSMIDGKPIITLPPKTEEIQHVVFDDDETAFYAALETKTQLQFNKYMKAGTVGKNYTNVLVLLLRLRQACCHPHLIQDFEEAPAVDPDNARAMMELAKSLAPDVVNRILSADGAFECPVCYDAVVNPKIITPCGHDTCTECMTRMSDQADQQNVAEGHDGGNQLRCPTCRGSLAMNKVIDHSMFKKVHDPDPEKEETGSESDSDSDDDSESEADEDSDGDLRGFVVPDDIEDTDDEEDDDNDADEDEAEVAPKRTKSKSKRKEKPRKPKGKEPEKKPHLSIAMLKKEATKTVAGRRRYMKYLRKHWQPSAKVTKCVELLETFITSGQKTIIFSQFVSLLDLLQVPIDDKKWQCLRYDGTMSAESRNDAINRFTDSRDHNIMLISLKAGNAGLNLVAASKVIILDPFWNPFIEMQAVDRAYRIGQQNPVEVHRILIEGTVEDRIIKLQEQKRQLVESALDENAAKSMGRLDIRQLAFLFNGN